MTRALRREDVFQAIAHPMRRRMLASLQGGEMPASALAEPFGVSLPAVSQQLKVLKDAGLVTERREGRQRLYRLEPERLREVHEWVAHFEKFWNEKLDALGEYLSAKHAKRRTHGED